MAVMLLAGSAAARDRVSRDPSVLPAPARAMLAKHFPKVKVSHIKIDDKLFGGDEYEVILNNGAEIDFRSDGSWKEIDCGSSAVPSGLVLKPIADYVRKYYKGQMIVAIDIDHDKYEIELLNGIDLEFDRSGKFLRQDD